MARSCWRPRTSRVTWGVTDGLPSRSPPTQVPNRRGRAAGARSTPQALQLLVEVVEQVGDDVVEQLLEQVQGRRRLLDRLRPAAPELVGLPEQLHDLGEPTLPAVPLRPGRAGPGLQQLPDLPHLGEHRPAGGLGGVGREHRPHLHAPDHRLEQRAGRLLGGDPVDEGRQLVAVLGVAVEAAGLVDLLDHVGQVEVGRERPHEEDLGGKVDARQHLGQPVGAGVAVAVGRGAWAAPRGSPLRTGFQAVRLASLISSTSAHSSGPSRRPSDSPRTRPTQSRSVLTAWARRPGLGDRLEVASARSVRRHRRRVPAPAPGLTPASARTVMDSSTGAP